MATFDLVLVVPLTSVIPLVIAGIHSVFLESSLSVVLSKNESHIESSGQNIGKTVMESVNRVLQIHRRSIIKEMHMVLIAASILINGNIIKRQIVLVEPKK